jgi:hypothetical protein
MRLTIAFLIALVALTMASCPRWDGEFRERDGGPIIHYANH